jgi:hypothetical protein
MQSLEKCRKLKSVTINNSFLGLGPPIPSVEKLHLVFDSSKSISSITEDDSLDIIHELFPNVTQLDLENCRLSYSSFYLLDTVGDMLTTVCLYLDDWITIWEALQYMRQVIHVKLVIPGPTSEVLTI